MRWDFQVYRADGQGAAYSTISDVPVFGSGELSYVDTAVRPSTSYWYRLGFVDVTGRETLSDPVQVTTSTWAEEQIAMTSVSPSPARGDIMVRFSVPETRSVRVSVYDTAGRLVCVLGEGPREKGDHTLSWSGRDTHEERAGSGVYFVRLTDGRTTETRKVVLRR